QTKSTPKTGSFDSKASETPEKNWAVSNTEKMKTTPKTGNLIPRKHAKPT
ncbi:10446_t:CDS:1, partial [Gigaspora rosea]